jgi:hypothetical protein
MGDHMPGMLKQAQVRSGQRLVEVSGLFGLDYLISAPWRIRTWQAIFG